MTETQTSGKLWMWGTVLSVGAFILFFAGFAIWTFQTDVELVYDNYYAKDVVYGDQIRRIERTDALVARPTANYNRHNEMLTLKYPSQLNHSNPIGTVLMFRPADLHKDRLFPLELVGDTLQMIHLPDLDPGLWRVKLDWASGGLEYYLEQTLMVR